LARETRERAAIAAARPRVRAQLRGNIDWNANLKGSIRDLIDVLSRNLTGVTKKITKDLRQDNRCPGHEGCLFLGAGMYLETTPNLYSGGDWFECRPGH
jgi:hypothetical protein